MDGDILTAAWRLAAATVLLSVAAALAAVVASFTLGMLKGIRGMFRGDE